MTPKEVKKFVGKFVKVEVLDHATYDNTKDVSKEGPCILMTYGIIKLVSKEKNDHWFLNLTYDSSYEESGKLVDESGSTYLLNDILSITEMHE